MPTGGQQQLPKLTFLEGMKRKKKQRKPELGTNSMYQSIFHVFCVRILNTFTGVNFL